MRAPHFHWRARLHILTRVRRAITDKELAKSYLRCEAQAPKGPPQTASEVYPNLTALPEFPRGRSKG